MAEQLQIGPIESAADEDRKLGLELWSVEPALAEALREWARTLNVLRPRRIIAYTTRGGELVVTVKQEIEGKQPKVVGGFRARHGGNFGLLWATRFVDVGPEVPSEFAQRVRQWASRRWKAPVLRITRDAGGLMRLWMPATSKRGALDESVDVFVDLDEFYLLWRASNALRRL